MTAQSLEHADLYALRNEVSELRADVRELIDAWKTAKGLVRLVKLIGVLAVAYTAVWSMLKLGGK